MESLKEKEIFTSVKAGLILFGIILLACVAHFNFFMQDMRPFVDHDYNYAPGFHLSFLYDIIILFLGKFFPEFSYSGVYLYKTINIVCFVTLIVFVYLTAAHIYNRAAGLLAAFWIIGSPYVLNVYHKAETSSLTATLFAMLIYFAIRCEYLRKFWYSVFFILVFVCFTIHHYGSLLYFMVMLLVLLFSQGRMIFKTYLLRRSVLLLIFFSLLLYSLVFFYNRYALSNFFWGWGYQADILVDSDNNFNWHHYVLDLYESLYSFYNAFSLYFNFYILNALGVLLYFIGLFIYQKINATSAVDFEFKMSLIALGYFLVLIVGKGVVVRYSASIFYIIAVLNSGMVLSLYYNFKKNKKVRFAFVGYLTFLFVYVVCSLFIPNKISSRVYDESCWYSPVYDNYNIDCLMDFCNENNLGIDDIDIVNYDEASWSVSELLFFYISLEQGSSMHDFLAAMISKEIHGNIKYIGIIYSVKDSFLASQVPKITDIEDMLSQIVLENIKKVGFSAVELSQLVPYGQAYKANNLYQPSIDALGINELYQKYPQCKQDIKGDLFFRSFLIFIYKVKK